MTDTATSEAPLAPALAAIRDDFLALAIPDRLQLLLEFSRSLPDLPEHLAGHDELLERVVECQSPISVLVEVDDDGGAHFFASAPPTAPTSRGFAGILAEGLDGLSAEQVLAVPDDYPFTLGLGEAVSMLRLRGMTGLLTRVKRQVRAQTAS